MPLVLAVHLLSLVPLLFLPLSSASDVPLRQVKPGRESCHGPLEIPILDSEMLDPVNLTQIVKPFRNMAAMYGDSGYSGGTDGFIPEGIRIEKTPRTRPWKAPHAERLSVMRPNRTGLYYRDQVLNYRSYPWSTIGRLFFERFAGSGGWCTAALVGRNLILTASHCFPWGFGPGRWMRFVPAYSNGTEPYGGSYVSQCRGVKNTFNVTGIDYIICHLCDPLGEVAGWMGTQWWSEPEDYIGRPWRSSGYPADSFQGNTQMLLSNVNLTEVEFHSDKGKELESDIFASPGWSGGPMWGYIDGAPKIVGVCSGSEKDCSEQVKGCYGIEGVKDIDTFHDVSAGGRLMTDLTIYGMTHWADDDEDDQKPGAGRGR
ncbi:trypsin-like cysteine/serine peptidase domain-containing protein [Thermoascus aurantiacus ATCC 26904]